MSQIRPVSDLRNSIAEILRAAEAESEATNERYEHDEVMADIRKKLRAVRNVYKDELMEARTY